MLFYHLIHNSRRWIVVQFSPMRPEIVMTAQATPKRQKRDSKARQSSIENIVPRNHHSNREEHPRDLDSRLRQNLITSRIKVGAVRSWILTGRGATIDQLTTR